MPKLRKFYSRSRFVLLGIVLAIALFISTAQAPHAENTVELGKKLGKEIIAACPVVTDPQNLVAKLQKNGCLRQMGLPMHKNDKS